MTTTTISNERLAELSGWDVASALGCHYTGDMDPINHGGFFYDIRDWQDNGYACVVEFWEDPETNALVVQPGTIHRLKGTDLDDAFKCIGCPTEERGNIHAQIEACRAYAGIEPDGTEYPHLKTFDLDTWKDRNIWKSVRGWIEALNS